MDNSAVKAYVEKTWDESVIPKLVEYIAIPNISPIFDPEWNQNGLIDKAAALLAEWAVSRNIPGFTQEVLKHEGKTPLIYMEVQATNPKAGTVLMYGHLDKQPPFEGWTEGLGPYTPVIKDDKLYGRGGADDGYAIFSALTAIESLKAQGIPHGRCVIIIEACEESGSRDLPAYIEALKPRIGTPELIVCLDSGAGDYNRLWITTSLRGIVVGELKVEILHEGVHSGDASGIVADSFRIARHVLSRVEDPETGKILVPELQAEIPQQRVEQTKRTVGVLNEEVYNKFPFVSGAQPVQDKDLVDLALNRTWRAQLAVTGAGGLPALKDSGNVLRPSTTLKLSMRLPPTVKPPVAMDAIKRVLEQEPPYNAKVTYNGEKGGAGWDAPAVAEWLEKAADKASSDFYGQPACYIGEGGSIPFMGMLGDMYPSAQFLIIGVLGPNSNAHGPNEFLHIPFAKRLTCCVASVLAEQSAKAQ